MSWRLLDMPLQTLVTLRPYIKSIMTVICASYINYAYGSLVCMILHANDNFLHIIVQH